MDHEPVPPPDSYPGLSLIHICYIVTCAHVIEGATTVKVTLTDGTSYDATVVGSDTQTDIALIKIEATGLTSAVIGDSDTLVVGEPAIAIGNPLGELGGTTTVSYTHLDVYKRQVYSVYSRFKGCAFSRLFY